MAPTDMDYLQPVLDEISRLHDEIHHLRRLVQIKDRALKFCKECMNQSVLQDDWVKKLEEIEKGIADE